MTNENAYKGSRTLRLLVWNTPASYATCTTPDKMPCFAFQTWYTGTSANVAVVAQYAFHQAQWQYQRTSTMSTMSIRSLTEVLLHC